MAINSDLVYSTTPGGFRLRWDVFLSFRGEDTRHSFTKNLYDSLVRNGVRVFRDDDALDRGDEIAPSLLEAIDDSAASIIIISDNFANSHSCLEELAKICDCRKLILPVFHEVDPANVRGQRGPFEVDFRSHESSRNTDDVLRWRSAMKKVGGIAGWVYKNSDEAHIIQSLVNRVLKEIRNTPLAVAEITVGLDSRVEKLMKMLDVKSNGVRVLGLYGLGGVGKTTLAKALYNKLVGYFEHYSFISSVREISAQDNGLIALQNKSIRDLSHGQIPPVMEFSAGLTTIKTIVNEKRVFVILDDVDNVSQLNATIAKRQWFYHGSRVIITTRDREVLPDHLVTDFFEVRELNSNEALQLFSLHALRRERPTHELYERSEKIVSKTGGLPLALEVFGTYLFDKRTVAEWDDALKKLGQIRPGHLHDVLKISYDGLDDQEKCIFLDIACLFAQMKLQREDAVDIFEGCGFAAEIAITDLTAKSLIKITSDMTLWMHDQIRDMGRQIVSSENLVNPAMRTRLWDRNDILRVLNDKKGEKAIQGMVLDFENKRLVEDPRGDMISWRNFKRNPNFTSALLFIQQIYKEYVHKQGEKAKEIVISTKPFEMMTKLRLLQVNNVNLQGKLKFLPDELKWLQWKGCPLNTLSSDFCPQELAILDLSESKVKYLWGSKTNKMAENLTILNLQNCHSLAALPDLSGNQKLKKLILEYCTGLSDIHESVGNMNSLIHLNLRGCSNLINLPSDVSGLKRLENLILSYCSKLKELPENIGSMKSLKNLLVDNTAIASLPESIFLLTLLEQLSLSNCIRLKQLPECSGKLYSLKSLSLNGSALEKLPDSIGSLENLERLDVIHSKSLTVLPESIGNIKALKELFVSNISIKELPDSICLLPNLMELWIGGKQSPSKLPNCIGGLYSLTVLEIDETSMTELPHQIGDLKLLEKLSIRNCTSLKSLPESIGSLSSLTTLVIVKAIIKELPESIGLLENLVMLRLNDCQELCKLPDSIGKLKSLHRLLIRGTSVAELPESFGKLSKLMRLEMTKKPPAEPSISNVLEEKEPKHVVLPNSFSNLSLLREFYARYCNISGKISDDFEKLSSLEILDLGYNKFCSLPSSLRGLSILKKLLLPHCKHLKSVPLLPSSLLELNVTSCISLESISDMSNLEYLDQLDLTNCDKLVDIPGLECLKSLRRLYMSGCRACSLVVKKRLAKASLRHIRNLSIPGSKIPDWFTSEIITFSERKNRPIKGVIIGVVVSLNHQLPNACRDQYPAIVDIQAQILKLDYPIFTTALPLFGVPNTDEDQFHLCRYSVDNPLVSQLKVGYKIEVKRRDPPYMKGVELKRYGIYLVYEGDDDYEGDEKSLSDGRQSLSEKLAKYFNTFEEKEDYPADCEADRKEHEIEEIQGPTFHLAARFGFFASHLFSFAGGVSLLITAFLLKKYSYYPFKNK